MEELDIKQEYRIDIAKLNQYYERMKNQYSQLKPHEVLARFLISHSIGTSVIQLNTILGYYKDKLQKNKELLDLAFEWIRAQEIRLLYKKYLITSIYSSGDLNLAVDDCIFKFFLDYDEYLRRILFCAEIKEYEIGTLYEFFFRFYEDKIESFDEILKGQNRSSPTIIFDSKKVSTRINTLRSGLSKIIEEDYKSVLKSRNKDQKTKIEIKVKKTKEKEIVSDFSGSMLERLIKSCCITKRKLPENEIEKATSQFLTGYFKFGKFYEFKEFKELMKTSLCNCLFEGLTDKFKNQCSSDELIHELENKLMETSHINDSTKFDGIAWKNDLQPILSSWIIKFLDELISE